MKAKDYKRRQSGFCMSTVATEAQDTAAFNAIRNGEYTSGYINSQLSQIPFTLEDINVSIKKSLSEALKEMEIPDLDDMNHAMIKWRSL